MISYHKIEYLEMFNPKTYSLIIILALLIDIYHKKIANCSDFELNKRYIILRLHRLGLANRIRSMADWYQIVGQFERHLLVSWLPTPDCNVSFTDMFENGLEGIQI